jgi:CheY-like chemotaxis protein
LYPYNGYFFERAADTVFMICSPRRPVAITFPLGGVSAVKLWTFFTIGLFCSKFLHMRILIAEDNPVFRMTLEALLKKWGHEVISTTDGTEAWKRIQAKDAPQIAVLDWDMPGMTGIEICKKLRESKGSPTIYVILLTLKTEDKDLVQGLESGADDYVTKEFHPAELRARIRIGERVMRLESELAKLKK